MTPEERKWHEEQCIQYRKDYPIYMEYATALERMLKAACKMHAPVAIVQARPKSFASFAEKIARKRKEYIRLGIGPTDLCAARVITETEDEADLINATLANAFDVDLKNSGDTLDRLRTDQFGYRSYHFVVQLRGKKIFGEKVPPKIGARKAEIQVRTLLQHAHASIGHDRFYKTSLTVHDHLKRQMSRTAALLEEADKAFGECVHALNAFKVHYGASLSTEKLEEERGILESVLKNEPEKMCRPGIALRLAKLARSIGNYDEVKSILAPYCNSDTAAAVEIKIEHAHACCRTAKASTSDFEKGLKLLNEPVEKPPQLNATRLGYRAWAISQISARATDARDAYREALDADPSNPFHLASFLEYEFSLGTTLISRGALEAGFNAAIRACRDHIDAGVEVPWSYCIIGRLELLLNHPYPCLSAYAKAVQLCLEKDSTVPLSVLKDELVFVHRINVANAMPELNRWVESMLQLAIKLKTHRLLKERPERRSLLKPVTILAGSTTVTIPEPLRNTIIEAFTGYHGTIISGGTNSGVPALAGDIATEAGITAIGYIPKNIPNNQAKDGRYGSYVDIDSETTDPGQCLHYWKDLLASKIKPEHVCLLAIDGGSVSLFEYQLALAFGADVALLEPLGGAAEQVIADRDWKHSSKLITFVPDHSTLRAFIMPASPTVIGEKAEPLAMTIHESYRKKQYTNPDAAMQPWATLEEKFRRSNYLQAVASVVSLQRLGFKISKGKTEPPDLTHGEIETLAELEHGRWIIERLQSGWRYGEVRDTEKKIHPDLVPWSQLAEKSKDRDRAAVAAWPKLLSGAGFLIRRIR